VNSILKNIINVSNCKRLEITLTNGNAIIEIEKINLEYVGFEVLTAMIPDDGGSKDL
jgi:hypothetical protein